METFTKLFGSLLVFVYHCFDRIVINGYLSGLSRPDLSQRTNDYQVWVESFARNHKIPIEWAGKGVRKEDYVLPVLRRMEKRKAFGVYFIFKSMEQGRTFRISVPKYPAQDPNHRILAHQTSRFTHYYFYIRDEVLGPVVIRMASFFPFHAPVGLTVIRSWSRNSFGSGSASARTITPFWPSTMSRRCKPPPTGSARGSSANNSITGRSSSGRSSQRRNAAR
jgi:hypothetical protein